MNDNAITYKAKCLTLSKFDIKKTDENNIIITDYLSWSKFLITVKIKKNAVFV